MILIIDCSTEKAFVCLADRGIVVATKESNNQKNHASFLHKAIKDLMEEANLNLRSLDAVAVVSGPGSYTGVRIAMASAKGLCLALKKPLILLNGLELLARACHKEVKDINGIYIPMIDARRMEVFTAVYNSEFQLMSPAVNHILEERSFKNYLTAGMVYFVGNGVSKAKELIINEQAIFCENYNVITAAADFAQSEFDKKISADIINSEPLYIKPFFEG